MANEAMARSELMAARGGFDPVVDVTAKLRTGGYYELRRLDVEIPLSRHRSGALRSTPATESASTLATTATPRTTPTRHATAGSSA